MRTLTGSCLCGRVQYRLPDRFDFLGFCHCSECRKATGSAFSSVGGLPETAFEITAGAEAVATYAKSADSELGFCRECGSGLFSRRPRRGMLHLRLGTLDDAPSQAPTCHIFVASKAPWFEWSDDLPRYAERLPRNA